MTAAPKNRIWTVNDLHQGGGPGIAAIPSLDSAASSDSVDLGNESARGGGAPTHLQCYHIPNLPKSDLALLLLQRVVREFEPIAKERGYNIASVSEMCCCGDGLDFRNNGRRVNQRRRLHVNNNVWGYNQWTNSNGRGNIHTIHLRLRHPRDHNRFLLYEDVAGTMAHEMAHCVHGPHDRKFFALMDEILEQHAVLMVSGLSRNGGYSMPAFSGNGHTLGTVDANPHSHRWGNQGHVSGVGVNTNKNKEGYSRPTLAQVRAARLYALDSGRKNGNDGNSGAGTSDNCGGRKLGGDNSFVGWMSPGEAATVAAEVRRRAQQLRLRGDQCCLPGPMTIDMTTESGSDDGSHDRSVRLQHANDQSTLLIQHERVDAANRSLQESNVSGSGRNSVTHVATSSNAIQPVIIDLTDEFDTTLQSIPPSRPVTERKWSCQMCTLHNPVQQNVCIVCESPRYPKTDDERHPKTGNERYPNRDDVATKSIRLRVFK